MADRPRLSSLHMPHHLCIYPATSVPALPPRWSLRGHYSRGQKRAKPRWLMWHLTAISSLKQVV